MISKELKDMSHSVSLFLGAISIAIGFTVMLGWMTQNMHLITITPLWPPMQFNLALCIFLLGVCIIAISLKYDFVGAILSFIIFLFATLGLAQYAFKVNFGVDEFFVSGSLTKKEFYPGRMSMNAAVCLMVLSISNYLIIFRQSRWCNWISGSFCAFVVGIAVSVLVGHTLSLEQTYGWGGLVFMSIHTALAIFILAVAQYLIALVEMDLDDRLGWFFYTLMVSALVFSICIIRQIFISARTDIILLSRIDAAEIVLIGVFSITVVLMGFVLYRFIRTNLELTKLKGELEKNLQTKISILRYLSHEVKNPLSAIFGFSELLKMGCSDEDHQKYLDSIHVAADHVVRLVNNLMEYAKKEVGKITLNLKPFMVRDWKEKMVSYLSQRGEIDQVQIKFQFTNTFPIRLLGDREKIDQIVYNLAENAIKHSSKGGQVLVSATFHNNRLTLSVKDFGKGISLEDQSKIFEVFEQVKDDSEKVRGAGIGLSLCKAYVEMMHGQIKIKSDLGKGTEFVCEMEVLPSQDKE